MPTDIQIEELNEYGCSRLEDDYVMRHRFSTSREKISREDFATGWMAMAVRHRLWSYFKPEAAERLRELGL